MAGLGSADRERVREASPIEQVIADYGVSLRPDGRTFKALCPFHKEKTPSFKIDPDRSTYRCFGCGEGGDVFSFVEKMDSLDFRGALSLLAERAGIELTGRRGPSPRTDERDADRQLAAWAARWFADRFKGQEGAAARSYLLERKFNDELNRAFGVGYAPPGWGGFTDAMRAESLDLDRGVRLGLLKRSAEGRVYDAFRQRVMFPIRDTRGQVIGFGGRHLELASTDRIDAQDQRGGDPPPKYINSPESELFHKGAVLYGQFEGRASQRSTRHLLLMEGYTDVMMAHQHGFDTAVATLGTALTAANVEQIARIADRVTLVFDGDRAGIEAARKAVVLFASRKIETRVVMLAEGEDPCEMLMAPEGPERFRARIEGGNEALDFFLERCFDGEDPQSAGGRDRASRAFYEFVEQLPSVIVQGTALERLSGRVGQPFGRIERDFADWRNPRIARRRSVSDDESGAPAVGQLLPHQEEGILVAALVGAAEAAAVFRLAPPARFTDPLLARIASRVHEEGHEIDPLGIESSAEKQKLLELIERRNELKIDEESALRLLVELVRRRLLALASALDDERRLADGATDDSVLIRRVIEIRRAGNELGARPPQHPEALVEILDRFESGPKE